MIFVLSDLTFKYELEKLTRLFLPFEKILFVQEKTQDLNSDNYAIAEVIDNKDYKHFFVSLSLNGNTVYEEKDIDLLSSVSKIELTFALMLFNCFYRLTNYRSPWGILTGVRPAKLMGKLISSSGESAAFDYFNNVLLVNKEKTNLCLECSRSENKITELSGPDSFSLYISIPFCPSRCSYCSFVSHSVEQAKRLIPDYIERLCEEIRITGDIANKCALKLSTVYIGGGTPTTLNAQQLTKIMDTVKQSFDISSVLEYTVEAGRPDTIDEQKLLAIKFGGATRISINPQTMNDDILKAIGRRHTVTEFVDAYLLAKKCGFENINVDLIAGLSGDTLESFKNSIDKVIELDPENVTVHSLSMKRASNLNKAENVFDAEQGTVAAQMVSYAYDKLTDANISPYYMYRQSKTVGNLENVGYAKKGFEGLYNVYIMDETHTILACGASAVTKLRQPFGDHIERIFNYKYPYEYISRFDELIKRKNGIIEFYNRFPIAKG